MIARFLSPLSHKLMLAAIVGLALALSGTMWRADSLAAERDRLRDRLAVSEANHAVTVASLDTLAVEMEAIVAAGQRTAARKDEALAEIRQALDATREEAARLRAETAPADNRTAESVLRSGV